MKSPGGPKGPPGYFWEEMMDEFQLPVIEPGEVRLMGAEAQNSRYEELRQKVELTFEETACYLGIAPRTLYNTWRGRGLTAYEDHRRRLFFKRAELDHYLKISRKVRRG